MFVESDTQAKKIYRTEIGKPSVSVMAPSKPLSPMRPYKKVAMASICLLPIVAMMPIAAHAQLTNTATVTGTSASGTLTAATATETVEIAALIASTNDSASGINGLTGATGVIDVFANDTLNGDAINPTDVTLTETVADPTGALTLNADGSVDVAPGTPAGTYVLTYEICETLNPTNCSSATATVSYTHLTLPTILLV